MPLSTEKASMSGEIINFENEEYVKIIETVPLLSQLTASEITKLADNLKYELFAAGEVLMTQGQKGDKFFIIKKGVCEVEIRDKQDWKVLATIANGDYCGEQALIYQDARRNATIRAKVETECLTIDRANFLKVFRDSRVRFAKRDAKRFAIQSENLTRCTIDKSVITEKSPEQIQ